MEAPARLARRLVARRRGACASPNFDARPAARSSRWRWSTRSACRRANTAATRSSACSPTGSTGTRIRTTSRSARLAGVGALPGAARRRRAAVRVVRRARLACRPLVVARPRRVQRLLDRHRARGPRRRDASKRAQYRSAGARAARAGASATRSTEAVGHEHVAPGRKIDPGPGLRLGTAAGQRARAVAAHRRDAPLPDAMRLCGAVRSMLRYRSCANRARPTALDAVLAEPRLTAIPAIPQVVFHMLRLATPRC